MEEGGEVRRSQTAARCKPASLQGASKINYIDEADLPPLYCDSRLQNATLHQQCGHARRRRSCEVRAGFLPDQSTPKMTHVHWVDKVGSAAARWQD